MSRGKIQKYLGMTLYYTVSGVSRINMLEFIDEILTEFKKMDTRNSGTKSSAEPENLFKVNEDCEKLIPEKSKRFHNLVDKTLYTTKRDRPANCISVALLNIKVREPDTNDCNKLDHLMKYLRKTRDLPLILVAGITGILNWWIDASSTVHHNMRGHTGTGLSMVRGFPVVTSTKNNLDTQALQKQRLSE